VADRYLDTLAPHSSAVFVLRYTPEFAQAVASEERNIRVGLSPSHQEDVYFFVGDAEDSLAGRRTPPPDPWSDDVTRPYWDAVRGILASQPPVLVLRSLAPAQFRQASAMGAREIGSGVMVLRGPAPPSRFTLPSIPSAVPALPAALGWALVMFGVLLVAGIGWARAFLSDRAPNEVLLGTAPAFGIGALILAAFLVDQAGLRLGHAGALVALVLAAGTGGLGAVYRAGRRGRPSRAAGNGPTPGRR
jgi:hypothetical protein